MKPRDHFIADRVGGVRLARLFSNVVSPPVMFAVLGLLLALRELPFWPALAWAAVYGFFVSLAPLLFVLYMLHSGRILELHMTNTAERHLPYLVAVLGSLFVLGLVLLFDGPPLLRCLALFNIVTLVILGVINARWLVSFHATAATALATTVGAVFGAASGAALVPLVAIVAAVRLYLRRHTVAQIIGGVLVGFLTVWGMTRLGCFT